MRCLFRITFYTYLSLSLSFCSMFSKSEEKPTDDIPKYENYHSSGIYNDIKGEGRSVSSEDYSDDDYGQVDEGGGDENYEKETDEIIISDSDLQDDNESSSMVQDAPLPVQKLRQPKSRKRARKKIASVSKFKNGMYRLSATCTMRKRASKSSKGVGKARKGKKLWMEKHNKNWVKVFKKSGPVYINKICL